MTEDLSKRTREARQELRKFMRLVKRQNPERSCFLEYDKLYVDHRPYIWNEVIDYFFCIYFVPFSKMRGENRF